MAINKQKLTELLRQKERWVSKRIDMASNIAIELTILGCELWLYQEWTI